MFVSRKTGPGQLAELQRVEALVRARFGLSDEALVLVSEEEGRQPGLPPRLTTVLFWTTREARHRISFFKPPSDVTAADLPPGWLVSALRDDGENDCC